jgi:hypothetical protein
MSIHHPHPEYEAALIDSMHRYGNAIRGRAGLQSIHTLKDKRSDRLIGLAIFDSAADFQRLAPLARAAVEDDPFETWEQFPIDGLILTEV